MVLEFVDSVPSEEKSDADAIVDMTAHRKNTLIPLIKKTGGSGWIASNEEINTAQELTEKHAKIKVSSNGALALAGLMQAVFTGREWGGAVVCIIGGE
jgi:threonine synthase